MPKTRSRVQPAPVAVEEAPCAPARRRGRSRLRAACARSNGKAPRVLAANVCQVCSSVEGDASSRRPRRRRARSPCRGRSRCVRERDAPPDHSRRCERAGDTARTPGGTSPGRPDTLRLRKKFERRCCDCTGVGESVSRAESCSRDDCDHGHRLHAGDNVVKCATGGGGGELSRSAPPFRRVRAFEPRSADGHGRRRRRAGGCFRHREPRRVLQTAAAAGVQEGHRAGTRRVWFQTRTAPCSITTTICHCRCGTSFVARHDQRCNAVSASDGGASRTRLCVSLTDAAVGSSRTSMGPPGRRGRKARASRSRRH